MHAGPIAPTKGFCSGRLCSRTSRFQQRTMSANPENEPVDGSSSSSATPTGLAPLNRCHRLPKLISRLHASPRAPDPAPPSILPEHWFLTGAPHVYHTQVSQREQYTIVANILDICKRLYRHPGFVVPFFVDKLSASAILDRQGRLVLCRLIQYEDFVSVLEQYIAEYVICPACKSLVTQFAERSDMYLLECYKCKAQFVMHHLWCSSLGLWDLDNARASRQRLEILHVAELSKITPTSDASSSP